MKRREEQWSRARWASVVVVLCYSTSSGGPSSSTYDMLVTLEVTKLNAWLKLEQPENIRLEGVGRWHARSGWA